MAELVNMLAGVTGDMSLSGSLSDAVDKISKIVDTILTIIYIVLGLFLVIKGALLGMQIVKAADEPQVRQEKIGSLKWLVIGVAIAYAVTFAAGLLVDYFKGALK